MNEFVLDFHTKIFFGPGTERQIGKVLAGDGISRVMIHYDGVAESLGLLEKITGYLKAEGIEVHHFGGVRPNPSVALVREGIQACWDNKIECIVALGGGSTIDSSKAMVVGAGNPGTDVWEYYEGTTPAPKTALKMVVVSTTAATGSETNASSVLSNDDGDKKRSFFCDASRASYAFMDPELLYTLPDFQRKCTVCDIFVHLHERYCAHQGENRISDECSEGTMRVLLDVADTFVRDHTNYNAASEVMWAGSFAYMCCGLGGPFDWGTHNLAHEVSGHYHNVTHATAITAMWGHWARYVVNYHVDRFAHFAKAVYGIELPDKKQQAMAGIEQTEAFFRRMDMPTSLYQTMGRQLSGEEIRELAESCTYRGKRPTVGAVKALDVDDLAAIYNMANKA